jgi:TM2 domain-containing membrane protein YozV
MSTGPTPGSSGNVIAALCSLFIPGLGQLVQGRVILALVFFVMGGVIWFVTFGLFGWVVHLIACINAAMYRR